MLLSVLVVNIRSFFPVIICIALIYKTTRVSQIMATMAKMKVPKGVTISLAIAIRYIPTLTEEWKHIREAMWMRSVTSGFNNPLIKLGKKLECYFVPLFVSAIKPSDDLSAAAMTRGLDNPTPHTCRNYRTMNGMDYFMIFMSVGITIFCAVLRYVSVSYTHLDVYKRQAILFLSRVSSLAWQRVICSSRTASPF